MSNTPKQPNDDEVETTGHVWDGIEEYNNPLPRWWLWVFYATIVYSVGYMIAYPAWPLVSSATQGIFGTSASGDTRLDVEAEFGERHVGRDGRWFWGLSAGAYAVATIHRPSNVDDAEGLDRALAILAGLGFDDAAQQRPCSSYSGGWQMRIALGKILLQDQQVGCLGHPCQGLVTGQRVFPCQQPLALEPVEGGIDRAA